MASIAMEEMRRISVREEKEARHQLGQLFGLTVENEEIDLRGSILLDYLYDTFMFAVKKGISWDQCYSIVKLAKDLLEDSIGKSLGETVKLYTSKCRECHGKISSKNLEACTNFIFQSYMMHFNLYQYVFTQNREELTFKISKTVESPEEPLVFTTGKPEKIWNYEQKIKEIEDILQQRETERQEKGNDDLSAVQNIYKELWLEPPIDHKKMRTLVGDVARAHLTAATSHLKTTMSDTMDDLELMLKKVSIPKPREMSS